MQKKRSRQKRAHQKENPTNDSHSDCRYSPDPDDLARDSEGRLVEIEAEDADWDSTEVAKNKHKESLCSRAKNARRATVVIKKFKTVSQASNRRSKTHIRGDANLWREIKNRDGNKRHLSVHTNTETGRVRVFERDEYGDILYVQDDFIMDHFEDIKQGLEEIFKQ